MQQSLGRTIGRVQGERIIIMHVLFNYPTTSVHEVHAVG